MGRSPQGKRPEFYSSQITSPLNGPADFLKRLNANVCKLTSSVGKKLRAHNADTASKRSHDGQSSDDRRIKLHLSNVRADGVSVAVKICE